jgi:hypothetical protein
VSGRDAVLGSSPQPGIAKDGRTPATALHLVGVASRERAVSALLLGLAVTFNLQQLYPEVAIRVPMLNDGVLHLLNVGRVVVAVAGGHDPTDPWLAGINFGFPLFHYYQHLAYLPPAGLYLVLFFLLGETPALADVFAWTTYLLLAAFPVSIYWSARAFGLDRLPSAMAGMLASLLATDGLYGLDLASYVWRGFGLYTQLWGMVLLPIAVGQGYVVLRHGRGYFWAVVLLAATLLSHLVFGYIALASVCVFALLGTTQRSPGKSGSYVLLQRAGRLTLMIVPLALATSYFVAPFLADGQYLNRSVWERPEKYDSYGHEWVLGKLVTGDLFDYGRFPSLTLLAGLGLVTCCWRWREERFRAPLVLAGFWLLLYFGRPTWGVLLNLLPMSHDLHVHRLIAGVHLGGIYLVGLGLSSIWLLAFSRRGARYWLSATVVTGLLLFPVYRERMAFLGDNARFMLDTRAAYAAEQADIDALVDTLRVMPPGRVYAGLGATWGKDYRVGAVPMYALLQRAGFDMLGYLYHSLSLNADIEVLFDERRAEQYDLFNVRYVVAPIQRSFPEFVKPVRDFGRHRLYQVETTGYFDLVGSDLTFVGNKNEFYSAASKWLGSDEPRVKQHPVLRFSGALPDYRQSFPLAQAGGLISRDRLAIEPPRGRVLAETALNNVYLARVEVERESTLVLKSSFHPNWHAFVDGVEVEKLMVMPSYLGVQLGPGTHAVRFEYRPGPLRGFLMLLALLTLVLTAVAERRRHSLARITREVNLARPPTLAGQWAWQVGAWLRSLSAHRGLGAHLPFLGGVGLLALLSGLPLFQFKLMSGHDALEYLPRNVEFYQMLLSGQPIPRWASDLSGGYGEPFFNFNPPLFYYLSAMLHNVGFSFIAAENLACFALLLLAGVGMYLLASKFFGRRGGLVSAAAYLFAPYVLVTLYVRHALADFSALAFIPLAFGGLYRFSTAGGYGSLLVGAVSLALLLLSSSPLALITTPCLGVLIGWLTWDRRSLEVFLRGAWCLALGLGVSSFFWLPALLEREFVHTHRLLESFLDYHNHFLYVDQLLSSAWGYGLSVPGRGDGMGFGIGPVHLALSAAALLLLWRLRRASALAAPMLSCLLLIGFVAAFFCVYASQFLWERLSLLQYIEYPWRFLSLIAVATAFTCGFPFLLLAPRHARLADGLMAALILGLLVSSLPHAKPEKFIDVADADFSPEKIAERYIAVTTAWEYEPIWVTERPAAAAGTRVAVVAGQGRLSIARQTPTEYQLRADLMDEAQLRVKAFYFPGWTLTVDGAEQAIDRTNPQGVMEFWLPQGIHDVRLAFADTPVRLWAMRVALLTSLLLFVPWSVLWHSIRQYAKRRHETSRGSDWI